MAPLKLALETHQVVKIFHNKILVKIQNKNFNKSPLLANLLVKISNGTNAVKRRKKVGKGGQARLNNITDNETNCQFFSLFKYAMPILYTMLII